MRREKKKAIAIFSKERSGDDLENGSSRVKLDAVKTAILRFSSKG